MISFIATAAILVGLLTVMAWWIAEHQTRSAIRARMQAGLDELTSASYPLTPRVLQSVSNLTESQVILLGDDRQILSSTISRFPARLEMASTDEDVSRVTFDHHFRAFDGQIYHLAIAPSKPPLLNISSSSPKWIVVLFPHSKGRQMLAQAAMWPFLTGLMTSLALGAIAAWLTNTIVRRLERIQQKVQHISEGNYEPIEIAAPYDELSDLARNVNKMSSELRTLEDRIHIAEREKLIHDLATGLSHDLRNTLTGARLAVQFHQKLCREQDPESIQIAIRQLKLAEDQLGRWLRITDFQASEDKVPIRQIVEEVLEIVKPNTVHLGSTLDVDYDPRIDELATNDPIVVRSAMLNLAINAVHAAGAGGQIRIRLRFDSLAEKLDIEVLDSGKGPDPTLGDKIFDPLVTTKPEGVGLGLTLVANAAKRLQGSVDWCRRNDQTCFTLTIPMKMS